MSKHPVAVAVISGLVVFMIPVGFLVFSFSKEATYWVTPPGIAIFSVVALLYTIGSIITKKLVDRIEHS